MGGYSRDVVYLLPQLELAQGLRKGAPWGRVWGACAHAQLDSRLAIEPGDVDLRVALDAWLAFGARPGKEQCVTAGGADETVALRDP